MNVGLCSDLYTLSCANGAFSVPRSVACVPFGVSGRCLIGAVAYRATTRGRPSQCRRLSRMQGCLSETPRPLRTIHERLFRNLADFPVAARYPPGQERSATRESLSARRSGAHSLYRWNGLMPWDGGFGRGPSGRPLNIPGARSPRSVPYSLLSIRHR